MGRVGNGGTCRLRLPRDPERDDRAALSRLQCRPGTGCSYRRADVPGHVAAHPPGLPRGASAPVERRVVSPATRQARRLGALTMVVLLAGRRPATAERTSRGHSRGGSQCAAMIPRRGPLGLPAPRSCGVYIGLPAARTVRLTHSFPGARAGVHGGLSLTRSTFESLQADAR